MTLTYTYVCIAKGADYDDFVLRILVFATLISLIFSILEVQNHYVKIKTNLPILKSQGFRYKSFETSFQTLIR